MPNLVYASSGHEVKTVIVAGRVLMHDGQVITPDEAAVRAEAQSQAEAVARRVAADPVHRGMALLAAMEAGHTKLNLAWFGHYRLRYFDLLM